MERYPDELDCDMAQYYHIYDFKSLPALIFDRMQWLCWSQTKDGQRGVNRPQSIAEKLIGKNDSDSEITAFQSGEDYEKARRKILGKEG